MPQRHHARRRAGVLILLVVAQLGALVSVAAPAHALSVAPNVNLRPCVDLANPNCAAVGTTGSGGIWKMRCWRDGSWATGNFNSNRWFLIVLNDQREGYVHSSFVGGQYGTPWCRDLPYVRAADWAIGQIGRTRAPEPWASYYSGWSPGPHAEWSGDCAKFTHMAFRYGAGVAYESGDAIIQYQKYKNRGLIQAGIPRYGEPVFYNIVPPYGHTAIYIGGTTIVTTRGMDGNNLPVERRSLYYFGNYLGWAVV